VDGVKFGTGSTLLHHDKFKPRLGENEVDVALWTGGAECILYIGVSLALSSVAPLRGVKSWVMTAEGMQREA
jgi:hypothetical protein